MSILYTSSGYLSYSGINRLVVNIEQDIGHYYRSLIPKWIPTNQPRYPFHITVVREHKEKIEPEFRQFWGKYQDEKIDFFYSPTINCDSVYFWLNIYSLRLEEIRRELGMWWVSRIAIPPAPFKKTFHVTIANRKV